MGCSQSKPESSSNHSAHDLKANSKNDLANIKATKLESRTVTTPLSIDEICDLYKYHNEKEMVSFLDKCTDCALKKVIPNLLKVGSIIPVFGSVANVALRFYNTGLTVFENITEFEEFKVKVDKLLTLLSDRSEVIHSTIQSDETKNGKFTEYIRAVIKGLYFSTEIIETYSTGIKGKVNQILLSGQFKKDMMDAIKKIDSARGDLYEYIIFYEYLPSIITGLQSNESSKEIRKILKSPMTEFSEDIEMHMDHILPTSRDWLHVSLRRWFEDPDSSRVFWLCAEAGMGKSAFTASTVCYYKMLKCLNACDSGGSINKSGFDDVFRSWGVFFCKFGDSKRSNGDQIICSLACQISGAFPAYKEALLKNDLAVNTMQEFAEGNKTWSALFQDLIITPLKSCSEVLNKIGTVLIVIDALDEIAVQGDKQRAELFKFLSSSIARLPNNVKVMLTSRPEEDIRKAFSGFSPVEIKADDPNHVNDLQEYFANILKDKLVDSDKAKQQDAVKLLMEKSERKFVYAAMVVDKNFSKLSDKKWTLDDISKELPDGLDDSYRREFLRIRQQDPGLFDGDILHLVKLLITMRKSLSVKEVTELLAIDEIKVKTISIKIAAMFPLRGSDGAVFNQKCFFLFHKSVLDFITDEERSGDLLSMESERQSFYINVTKANQFFGDRLMLYINKKTKPWSCNKDCPSYLYSYLLDHLDGAEQSNIALDFLWNFSWLMTTVEKRGPGALMNDIKKRLDKNPEDKELLLLLKTIRLSLSSLQRDGKFLRRILPFQLYTRLQSISNDEAEYKKLKALRTLSKQWLNKNSSWFPTLYNATSPLDSLELSVELPGDVNVVVTLGDHRIACGCEDKNIYIVDASTGDILQILTGHTEAVYSLAILQDERIVSGSADETIKIWNSDTGVCDKTLTGHTDCVRSLAILLNGRIVSGSADKTIKIWNSDTGTCDKTLTGHTDHVISLAILPDGRIVSGSANKTKIKIWNSDTGICDNTLIGHASYVYSVAILHGRIVSGSADKTIKIWNSNTGVCDKTLTGHTDNVTSVAILHGRIVSGSDDRSIKIWNVDTGICDKTLTGHTHTVTSVAILHGRIISGSWDSSIKIWNVDTGICDKTLTGHTHTISSFQVLSSEYILSIGGCDENLFFNVNTGECLTPEKYRANIKVKNLPLSSSVNDTQVYKLTVNEESELNSYMYGRSIQESIMTKDLVAYGSNFEVIIFKRINNNKK